MAPPKAAKKAAAKKSGYGDSAAKSGNPEEEWLQSQLRALQRQRVEGPAWLQARHQWHEEQLDQVLEKLRSSSLATLPADFREAVEFYVSQVDADVTEESFYEDRELYAPLLVLPEASEGEPVPMYQRVVDESEEALQALEKVKTWTETSPHGISNLAKLLKAHAENAALQEAGLTRISGLLGEVRDQKTPPAGLAPRSLMPIVTLAMERFPQDKQVQRQGCSALRAISLAPGGLSACLEADGAKMLVTVMRQHLRDADVCRTAATSFATMVNKSQSSPVEMSRLRGCGAQALLQDILVHHCNDVQLDKVARQTIPFLKG